MKNPKLSIILTYRNAENVIRECIDSILNQTFNDFELICVNNASADSSEAVVIELTADNENVKRISLPECVDDDSAKNAALTISSGEYICFISSSQILPSNYIGEIVLNGISVKNNMVPVDYGKIYKREFLENSDVINAIISEKIDILGEALKRDAECSLNDFKEFSNENARNNIETINNKTFEIWNRFNQLEKTVFDKDASFLNKIDNSVKEVYDSQTALTSQIYNDISKIYDFINSELNKKGCEINKVYDEISKNYNYTESLTERIKDEIYEGRHNLEEEVKNRLYNLEKEIVVRYVNIKRLFDIRCDELDSKIQALGGVNNQNFDAEYNAVEVSKVLKENTEKIYAHINNINNTFYKELSDIYRDLNVKLVAKIQEQQSDFENKINNLRDEFNNKIEMLKENSNK